MYCEQIFSVFYLYYNSKAPKPTINMQQSKLIRYLSALRPEEHRKFRDFLSSPYFSVKPKSVELYDYIRSVADYESPRLAKKVAFKRIFKKQDFKDSAARRVMSDLFQNLLEFFAYQSYQTQPVKLEEAQLSFMYEHDLSADCRKIIKGRLEDLETPQSTGEIEHLAFLHSLEHKLIEDEAVRNVEPNLENVLQYHEAASLINRIRHSTKALYYEKEVMKGPVYNAFRYPVLEQLNKQVEQHGIPLLGHYRDAYECLAHQKDSGRLAAYRRLKEGILEPGNTYSEEDAQFLFQIATSYCVHKMNQGGKEFLYEFDELWDCKIQRGMVDFNSNNFYNILKSKILRGKLEEAEGLLLNNQKKMTKEQASSYKSELLFAKQDYSNVLKISAKGFRDMGAGARVRKNLLKAGFELWLDGSFNEEKLEKLLKAQERWLKMKAHGGKAIESLVPHYMDFFQLLSELFKICVKDVKPSQKSLRELLQQATDYEGIPERPWLIKQIEVRIV